MAICKCGDGWPICCACCHRSGLLGYRGQTQEPKPQTAPDTVLGLRTVTLTLESLGRAALLAHSEGFLLNGFLSEYKASDKQFLLSV